MPGKCRGTIPHCLKHQGKASGKACERMPSSLRALRAASHAASSNLRSLSLAGQPHKKWSVCSSSRRQRLQRTRATFLVCPRRTLDHKASAKNLRYRAPLSVPSQPKAPSRAKLISRRGARVSSLCTPPAKPPWATRVRSHLRHHQVRRLFRSKCRSRSPAAPRDPSRMRSRFEPSASCTLSHALHVHSSRSKIM